MMNEVIVKVVSHIVDSIVCMVVTVVVSIIPCGLVSILLKIYVVNRLLYISIYYLFIAVCVGLL